jgi:hypothetical protein
LHIFGTFKGQEYRYEKEINERISDFGLRSLNDRIKYVLLQSRNIMRRYYLNGNLKSLENHLMAFLFPVAESGLRSSQSGMFPEHTYKDE